MSNEISKGDANNRRTVFGISNIAGEIVVFRLDDITHRLLVQTEGDNKDTNKAIEDLTEDINAGAYSATTSHTTQYSFIGAFFKFSTAESKTITISITNGTVEIPIWTKTSDTATSRVWIPEKDWKFPADWELKVDITQTAGACSAGILLLTQN